MICALNQTWYRIYLNPLYLQGVDHQEKNRVAIVDMLGWHRLGHDINDAE